MTDVRFIFYYYSYYCKLEFMIHEIRNNSDLKVCRINADNEKINDSRLFPRLQTRIKNKQTSIMFHFLCFIYVAKTK